MIRHIVCMKLLDSCESSKAEAKAVLLSMDGKVEMIRGLFVGVDFLGSERSYDIMLEILFDDRAALEAYQKHPYHVGVVKKYIHEHRSASVSIDCEV